MSGTWLAVDGGQSGIRARASWTDREATAAGYSHNGGAVSLLETLEALIASLHPSEPIGTIAIGHTGLPVTDALRRQFAQRLRNRTRVARLVLAPDEVTAHIGALGGGPGVVVAAGTGTVTLGVARDGRSARVDGWGYLFGDAGSAFSIGRAGLDRALRCLDGRAESSQLLQVAQTYFGADLRQASWELYGKPNVVDIVARFAPNLIACAESGDTEAGIIVEKAALEIAQSALSGSAPLSQDSSIPVSVTGRLMQPTGLLDSQFRRHLKALLPQSVVRPPLGNPLDGAITLARGNHCIHHRLIYQNLDTPL